MADVVRINALETLWLDWMEDVPEAFANAQSRVTVTWTQEKLVVR